ncbi:motile sperm domain-containing protein 2-like protein [Dinothrombium tinctorium]|uniref:Motile sperm domain-containing protein 2-like protein n=1 Tax=Dinothrombium tinctorium TaxID=1965070 RepID=A0A3S3QGP0_9ACAR|nr:motile sperm domain-containing protein 2-like protein [Dinothrombium tinctorium]RWS08564.1 motile sperm domain-containing protein 2-like protein [Dinothrombium tinctorium]
MSFAFKLRKSLTNSSITSIPSDSLQAYTVDRIKEKIMEDVAANPDSYDKKDVEKLTSTSYIRRYMERQKGEEDKTVDMMKKVLKKRKEANWSEEDESVVPIEFYKIGACFIYNEDKEGNPVLYMRVKFYRMIPELRKPMEDFVVWMMYKADEMGAKKGEEYGWTIVFDLTGVSMAQYDLPELLFLIQTFIDYFPAGLRRVYVNNIPWIFKPLVSVVLQFIPNEWKGLIKFIKKDEIFKYIEKKNVPKFLGGTCKKSYREVPEGSRSVKEMAKDHFDTYKVDEKKVEQILKIYEKMFQED